MQFPMTKAEVTNVNPRKENGEDGSRLASDVSIRLTLPKSAVSDLFPSGGFLDQFFSEDQSDTRLEVLCPLTYQKRIENLRITLDLGLKPMVFEGERIASGAQFTPQPGGYVEVKCKLQLHPTRDQSGKLDEAVKEWIEIAVEPMNRDIDDDEAPDDQAAAA